MLTSDFFGDGQGADPAQNTIEFGPDSRFLGGRWWAVVDPPPGGWVVTIGAREPSLRG